MKTIKADNYGKVLAQVNDMELIKFEEDGGYQGQYIAVLKDKLETLQFDENGDEIIIERLFYFIGSYGSCSGCDWLQDVIDWDTGEISYKEALDYCADLKPRYIVPIDKPLNIKNLGEYNGFLID
jgi:hypothetical protein